MNNRPHERYAKVVFDENWLEQFISDVLEMPINVCYSKSEFMGDKGKRRGNDTIIASFRPRRPARARRLPAARWPDRR